MWQLRSHSGAAELTSASRRELCSASSFQPDQYHSLGGAELCAQVDWRGVMAGVAGAGRGVVHCPLQCVGQPHTTELSFTPTQILGVLPENDVGEKSVDN